MCSYREGDRVIIQLNSQDIYEGDVVFYSETMVEITDIDYQNRRLVDNLCFYQEEINRIYQLTNKFPYLYHIYEDTNNLQLMKLPKDELQRLKDTINESIYITRIDKNYYQAIAELNGCECIGVVGLGHTIHRDKGFNLLAMSTFERIFIFDMTELLRLNKLKDIFTTNSITKIIHNGKVFNDCLFHKYNIKMTNIFDTQLADSFISQQHESNNIKRSLCQCLIHRLNLPVPFDDETVNVHDSKWGDRPLKTIDKVLISNLVAFLIPLRDHLTGILLKDYHRKIRNDYKQSSMNR